MWAFIIRTLVWLNLNILNKTNCGRSLIWRRQGIWLLLSVVKHLDPSGLFKNLRKLTICQRFQSFKPVNCIQNPTKLMQNRFSSPVCHLFPSAMIIETLNYFYVLWLTWFLYVSVHLFLSTHTGVEISKITQIKFHTSYQSTHSKSHNTNIPKHSVLPDTEEFAPLAVCFFLRGSSGV